MPGRHLRRHDLHPGPGRHRQQNGLPGPRGQLRHRLPRGPHPDDHHCEGHHPDHRRRGGDLILNTKNSQSAVENVVNYCLTISPRGSF